MLQFQGNLKRWMRRGLTVKRWQRLTQRQKQIYLVAGSGLCALLLGASVSVMRLDRLVMGWLGHASPTPTLPVAGQDAGKHSLEVASLALKSTELRAGLLNAIALEKPSLEQYRARYLLASDLIAQNQGEAALKWLQGLETDYPVMAPYVLLQQAQAYAGMGKTDQAKETWQALVQRYPQDPATAEALFALGKQEPRYWDEAIAQFPGYPRTHDITRQRLKQNPKQPQLLLLLAHHGFYRPDITQYLAPLTKTYAAQLKPEDWEAIAFAYWEHQLYDPAARAYAKAPVTPRNLYRVGRGLQLSDHTEDAITAYKKLVQTFPKTPETALGLIRLARITRSNSEAMGYADQVIKTFKDDAAHDPNGDRVAEALALKADLLKASNSQKSAAQLEQEIFTRYKQSATAAELRWQRAQAAAKAKDYKSAWQWAHPIPTQTPDSDYAPEAAFWVGKWAQQLGRKEEAKQAFQYVLTQFPASYYAWRAAHQLGLQVGDFTTVRQLNPQVVRPTQRSPLPTGSATLQELYALGQDQAAWMRWQVEFRNPQQPTVAEQFTDGVMRIGVGNSLDGIFMLASLNQRETATERDEYHNLKQQPTYWHALYPFPYLEAIAEWSSQRQLNPLLVTALIRQESRFESKIQSGVGATGLMQVMPETAAWIAEQIKLKTYKLDNPQDNIQLGTWYLDHTHDEYQNNSLFAVASYNAGPGNVADWIKQFGFSDPDVFVEEIPFDETRGYVKSVFENYWNYLQLYNPDISQQVANYISDRQAAAPQLKGPS